MNDHTTLHLDLADMASTFAPVLAEAEHRTQWHIRSGVSGYALFYGETPRALLFGTYEECKKTADAMNAQDRRSDVWMSCDLWLYSSGYQINVNFPLSPQPVPLTECRDFTHSQTHTERLQAAFTHLLTEFLDTLRAL